MRGLDRNHLYVVGVAVVVVAVVVTPIFISIVAIINIPIIIIISNSKMLITPRTKIIKTIKIRWELGSVVNHHGGDINTAVITKIRIILNTQNHN